MSGLNISGDKEPESTANRYFSDFRMQIEIADAGYGEIQTQFGKGSFQLRNAVAISTGE